MIIHVPMCEKSRYKNIRYKRLRYSKLREWTGQNTKQDCNIDNFDKTGDNNMSNPKKAALTRAQP